MCASFVSVCRNETKTNSALIISSLLAPCSCKEFSYLSEIYGNINIKYLIKIDFY